MAKMKAVQVSKANAPFEVVERDVPTPAAGQVRIRVAFGRMMQNKVRFRAVLTP